MKKPNHISSPSPKNKIRESKFVLVKKNLKRDKDKTPISVDFSVQEENPSLPIGLQGKSEEDDIFEMSGDKRRKEKLLDEARKTILKLGSGRVLHLVKAFENILTLLDSSEDKLEDQTNNNLERRFSSTLFNPSDLLPTVENLGLCSSLDGKSSKISAMNFLLKQKKQIHHLQVLEAVDGKDEHSRLPPSL
ncbi:unnamed protein product [Lactuca saligna]|uniref:Uncharacterized protein n=1 Tax=Lactuca saligna TaxID=75948 RepID=A0AA35V170_LACSI|nr:unnamed protein product [Lactuca saligna]